MTSDGVMRANDGMYWTSATGVVLNGGNWRGIAYGGLAGAKVFVAVAISLTGAATQQVMTSPTGAAPWTFRAAAANKEWVAVTFGGPVGAELFVAVSSGQSNSGAGDRVMTSPDGFTWTMRPSSLADSWDGWKSVTYGSAGFVAVKDYQGDRVMTSVDGISWTSRAAPALDWRTVTWGAGTYVAVSW
jgi:hypothetical protein